MPSFLARLPGRRAALLGVSAILLAAAAPATGATDFAIGPGGSTRGLGQSVGLDFRDGLLRAAWGDNSAALGGIPDPPAPDVAFAEVSVRSDGSVTVGTPVNASRAPESQGGPSLAVDPTDPDNLAVVADAMTMICCSLGSFLAYSSDGGATWQRGVDLPGALNGGGPQAAFDEFGNLFIALIDQSTFDRPALRVYLSVDGGATLQELPLPPSTELDAAPSVATGSGAVWVAFTRYDGVARVATASARVDGLGQVGTLAVRKAPGSEGARLPDVAVGPDGDALVVYEARPPGGPFNTLNAQLDADGLGEGGFSAPTAVANIGAYGSEALPDVAFDAGGRAHVAYRDQELRSDTQDVLLQSSADGGRTWGAALRVNDDVGSPTRRVPDVAAEAGGNRLAVAWFDQRAGDFRLRGRILDGAQAPATPVSPLNLAATAVSQTRVDLSWVDRSGNEAGFEIVRTSGTSTSTVTVGPNATSYSDTGLAEDTTYTYVVRAFNAAGSSTSTNQAEATTLATPPPAPTNLTAVGGGFFRVDLDWTASARAEGYQVFQSENGVDFAHVTTSFDNSTYVWGLEPGKTYFFKVRAFNSGGVSGFSNVASSTTELAPPAAPTALTATLRTSSRVDLSWTDHASNEDRFEIEESTNGKSFRHVASTNPNTTTISFFGLRGRKTYSYRVRACNAAGCSGYTNVASVTTPR